MGSFVRDDVIWYRVRSRSDAWKQLVVIEEGLAYISLFL